MKIFQGVCYTCGEVTTVAYGEGFPPKRWVCARCGGEWSVYYTSGSVGGYSRLQKVLEAAQAQAQSGKGHERHASDEAFEDQPIQWIEKYFGSFQLGQAVKKMHESQRLDRDAAIKELLGAINYLAARVIYLEEQRNDIP